MIEVVVVCEGQTEVSFVKQVIAPNLAQRNVFARPRMIATSPGYAGGSLTRHRVLRSLRSVLLEQKGAYVTTFFDLYGLPSDFPGHGEHAPHSNPLGYALEIEAEFHKVVVQETECRASRFFPHIQPYEFEALLFSDADKIVEMEPEWVKSMDELQKARRDAQSPEHINEGQTTHPSARLKELSSPRYNKVAHGVTIARRIGLDRICAECRHFNGWLTRIENLSPIKKAD